MSDLYEFTIAFSAPFWRGAARALDLPYQALTADAYSAIVRLLKERFGQKCRAVNTHVQEPASHRQARMWGIDVDVRDRCCDNMNRNTRQRMTASARKVAITGAQEALEDARRILTTDRKTGQQGKGHAGNRKTARRAAKARSRTV